MQRVYGGVRFSLLLLSLFFFGVFCRYIVSIQIAEAGKGVGEDAAYAREMGFEQRLYYVASGDGAGQVEYICKAFPGTIGSDSTASSVWQTQRFYYDSSNRLTRISFAGDDDSYSFSCDSRTSLDYD